MSAWAPLPIEPEPDVYLFVGFFSADGKTLEIQGQPAIALGLERFKDFRDLPLLVAHEYGHCAQKVLLKDIIPEEGRTLLSCLMPEGLAVLFTEALYPEIPLHRHLFIPAGPPAVVREKPGGSAGTGGCGFDL